MMVVSGVVGGVAFKEEILRIPFSRAPNVVHRHRHRETSNTCTPTPTPTTTNNNNATTNLFLLGRLKTNSTVEAKSSTASVSSCLSRSKCECVIYLHGFPDQSIDHRSDPKYYGTYHSRMSKKLSDAFVTIESNNDTNNDTNTNTNTTTSRKTSFFAFNFSGTPGSSTSTSTTSSEAVSAEAAVHDESFLFYDKNVSQEVWDVITVMKYLHQHHSNICSSGFHIIGLSTGAIIGLVLRNILSSQNSDSNQLLHKYFGINALVHDGIPSIVSISTIASCGVVDLNTALTYDFSSKQVNDFKNLGYCYKEFWLPPPSRSSGDNKNNKDIEEQRWVPQLLKLGRQYMDDFLYLPIQEEEEKQNNNTMMNITEKQKQKQGNTKTKIPLLVIHGTKDTNIPYMEGVAVYDAASEPKQFVSIPNGNHLLTNSKHMKRVIRTIQEYQIRCPLPTNTSNGNDATNNGK